LRCQAIILSPHLPSYSMPVRVVVVRHGERLDEADSQEWRRVRTRETQHDPPLTAPGWDQSKLAAGKLAAVLDDNQTHVKVYSSPTARTLSTAAAIACGLLSELPATVTPVYSLNCCAAAQRYGVAKAFPSGEPTAETLQGVSVTCWPPLGIPEQVDHRQGAGGGFVEATKELAALHGEGEALVLVTHREGIWQLLEHVGIQMRGGYCNITWLTFDPKTQALSSWDPSSHPCQAIPKATISKQLPVVQTTEANEARTLEAVLADGQGTVVVHRGPGRSGSGVGTLLWRTPGVRGVWCSGGAVPCGEVVQLRSSPMSSEGDEGDFVLIQRPNGIEGWTKVKNIRLR